jgi:ribonuclease Z
MARKKGHNHIEHLLAVLGKLGNDIACQSIILTHFSMKYSKSHIIETIDKLMPPEFKEKVRVFL